MKDAAIFMCEHSGVMARPWAEKGIICICVDIKHSIRSTRKTGYAVCIEFEGGGKIYKVYGDARSWKPTDFDKQFFKKYRIVFVACFPVCTNLAGSGSQDWGQNGKYDPVKGIPMLMDGLILFNSCEQIADWSGSPYCIENPVGVIPTHHRKADYLFHPWFYSDLYQKKTCLWTGNGFVMPEAEYITKPKGVVQKIWLETPGDNRAEIRSETPEGFARAVCEANCYSVVTKPA